MHPEGQMMNKLMNKHPCPTCGDTGWTRRKTEGGGFSCHSFVRCSDCPTDRECATDGDRATDDRDDKSATSDVRPAAGAEDASPSSRP